MNIRLSNGILNISYWDQFADNFEYGGFMQVIEQYPDDAAAMFRGFSTDGNGVNCSHPMVKLIRTIQLYGQKSRRNHYDGISWEDEGEVCREELEKYLTDMIRLENEWRKTASRSVLAGAAIVSILSTVPQAIARVTDDYRAPLTRMAVLETEIMILLHICAGMAVNDAAMACYEAHILPQMFTYSLKEAMRRGGFVPIYGEDGEIVLPLYNGAEGSLRLMWLHNRCSDAVSVVIQDSPLRRTLHPGQSVCVVMKAEAAVDFLPTFSVEQVMSAEGDMCFELHPEGLEIHALKPDGRRGILKREHPVTSWALAGQQNWLLADCRGQMAQGFCDPEFPMPQSPVIRVQAAEKRYCMLMEDGRLFDPARACDRTDLIGFSCDGTRLIAIASDRTLWSSDGRVTGQQVVQICQRDGACIALHADGHVSANVPLNLMNSAQAVAISDAGYVVALEKQVILCDAHGRVRQECTTQSPVEELVCLGSTVYARDPQTGTIVQLQLTPTVGHEAEQPAPEAPMEGVLMRVWREMGSQRIGDQLLDDRLRDA